MGKDNWPDRWIKADLETIVEKMANGANLKQSDVQIEHYLPISRIETIALEEIDLKRVKYVEVDEKIIEKYSLRKGDILFSHINSDKHLGKTAIFQGEVDLIHGVNLLLIRALEGYDKSLLNYLFKHYRFQGKFIDVAQRAVNQSSINQKKLNQFEIPIIPGSEQKRIVTKLDTLFGYLDTLNTRLDRIPELLKNFRQQVLTQAVTGKLTEEWRNENDIQDWILLSVGEFMTEVKDKENPQEIDEVNYVGLEHIESGRGLKEIGSSIGLKSIKTEFKSGDVLYGKLRPYLDKHFVAEFDGLCSTDILVYRNENINSAKFFNYYLGTSKTIKKANSESKGINLPRVSSKIINSFKINSPPLEEQAEIVRIVASFFQLADKIEFLYQSLKEKIDNLPQAILNKAFKGELVPQDPNDEPASVLLERIKEEKEKQKKESTKRKAKTFNPKVSQLDKELAKKDKESILKIFKRPMEILEVLKEAGKPMKAKDVWKKSVYKNDIDAFYAALKKEVEMNKIKESSDKQFIELAS